MRKPKVFQFGEHKPVVAKVPLEKRPAIKEEKPIEPPPGPIQGIMPDSVEEWRVANALWRLDIEFKYQYVVFGGRLRRGGQLIDFWVYTVPLPTPVYVQSEAWHGGARHAESTYKIQRLIDAFAGEINYPIEVWDYQLRTMAEAYQTMKGLLL